MAGFDRGVRPIGPWSTCTTLSSCFIPVIRVCLPGTVRAPFSSLASARYMISLTRVDLPEPDTPVTATRQPSGNATSTFRRLCSLAPLTTTSRLFDGDRRVSGTGIEARPDRYAPVSDFSLVSRSWTGPDTTTQPPCSPAPGPMSTTQSAARMVSSSCSTTISVFPRSRSRSSVSSSRLLSRWCRPIDGSSSTYSTPTSPDPIWVASRIRCASPPASVAEARFRLR